MFKTETLMVNTESESNTFNNVVSSWKVHEYA